MTKWRPRRNDCVKHDEGPGRPVSPVAWVVNVEGAVWRVHREVDSRDCPVCPPDRISIMSPRKRSIGRTTGRVYMEEMVDLAMRDLKSGPRLEERADNSLVRTTIWTWAKVDMAVEMVLRL